MVVYELIIIIKLLALVGGLVMVHSVPSRGSSEITTPASSTSSSPEPFVKPLPRPIGSPEPASVSLKERSFTQESPAKSSKFKNYFERTPLSQFLKSAVNLVRGKGSEARDQFNIGRERMTENALSPLTFAKEKLSPRNQDFAQHTQDLIAQLEIQNPVKPKMTMDELITTLFPQGEFHVDAESGEVVGASLIRKKSEHVEEMPYGDNIYSGDILNDEPHGEGIMNYSSGDLYVGHFNEGRREGIGSFTFATGEEFSGFFYQDRILFGSGTVFYGEYKSEGNFLDGALMEGTGIILLDEGVKYYGKVDRGMPHDEAGKLIYPDGREEPAHFEDGKRIS